LTKDVLSSFGELPKHCWPTLKLSTEESLSSCQSQLRWENNCWTSVDHYRNCCSDSCCGY